MVRLTLLNVLFPVMLSAPARCAAKVSSALAAISATITAVDVITPARLEPSRIGSGPLSLEDDIPAILASVTALSSISLDPMEGPKRVTLDEFTTILAWPTGPSVILN